MSVKPPEDNQSMTNDKVDFDNYNKFIPAVANEEKRSTNIESKEGAVKETKEKDKKKVTKTGCKPWIKVD